MGGLAREIVAVGALGSCTWRQLGCGLRKGRNAREGGAESSAVLGPAGPGKGGPSRDSEVPDVSVRTDKLRHGQPSQSEAGRLRKAAASAEPGAAPRPWGRFQDQLELAPFKRN